MPINKPLAKCCYKKDSCNCLNRPSQTSHTPICSHSCYFKKHCDAIPKLKLLLPIIFHAIPYPIRCANPYPIKGLASQPKQTLIFLFNVGILLKFPFITISKWLCVNARPWSHHTLLNEPPQIHKESNVDIYSTHPIVMDVSKYLSDERVQFWPWD